MDIIHIKIGNKIIDVEKGSNLLDILKTYGIDDIHKYVCAVIDNKIRDLCFKPENDCSIKYLDISNPDGNRVYVRSVSFIFVRAIRELFKDARVTIEHSLGNGLYCEVHYKRPITPRDTAVIEKRMNEIAEHDEAFEKKILAKDEAIRLFEEDGRSDSAALLKYRESDTLTFYKCGWMYDNFYGYMVPSTGYLKKFNLHFYLPGIILLCPDIKNPNAVPDFQEQPKLSKIYSESEKWSGILSVGNVSDLNNIIKNGKIREFICINEALQEKKIAQIADLIYQNRKKKRIVLIAGPSSSGKTTFAHRLAIELRVNGLRPISISLDNYFLDREKTPLDENGEYDFEDIHAIDIELFNEHLSRLLQGQTVSIPIYDFHTGKREVKGNELKLEEDQAIIIEGIHGLNDMLTEMIPQENKFKIYVSALTQLNLDDHNRIPSTDTRIIRRMVRDYKFRSSSPANTLGMWKSVRRGEEKYIFPYQENADIMFNSTLSYEFSVLKPYIAPLLEQVGPDSIYFSESTRLLKFLNYFVDITDEDDIPQNSILREFIGGCVFYK